MLIAGTVILGSLLVLPAVPAISGSAPSSCDTAATGGVAQYGGNLELVVRIGVDDGLVLWDNAGQYQWSVSGDGLVNCGMTAGASTDASVAWIHVIGSDAGVETFIDFDPPFAPESVPRARA